MKIGIRFFSWSPYGQHLLEKQVDFISVMKEFEKKMYEQAQIIEKFINE